VWIVGGDDWAYDIGSGGRPIAACAMSTSVTSAHRGRIAERDDVAVDVVASHQAAPAIVNTPTPSDRPQRPW
jgi:pyruvate/2-oxoacid:ferredoxin oxidoreductase beta subunit